MFRLVVKNTLKSYIRPIIKNVKIFVGFFKITKKPHTVKQYSSILEKFKAPSTTHNQN